ncbi:hypothetical protein [Pseudophaeobacter sp. C1-32P7]|uniref:hypothetical protein n=1 Tax=Pseudophaeobacter sp. C1-32P7 TaxID=3098142 RepID=UPI0034D6ED30
MRTLEQLKAARERAEKQISAWEEEDANFPDDKIYDQAIAGQKAALTYINRRISEEESI